MHLFTLLFDLYCACSCNGVLCLQWLQLVQRRGEMWRHRVQADDCSLLDLFFNIKLHERICVAIKGIKMIGCLTLDPTVISFLTHFWSLRCLALCVFDMRMVRQYTGKQSFIWDRGKLRRVRQDKCTHLLSFSLSLTLSPSRPVRQKHT